MITGENQSNATQAGGEGACNCEQEQMGAADAQISSLGKFKRVEDLLEAYNALEAQFTKRSQQLRALERENGLLKQEQANNSRAAVPDGESAAAFNEKEELLAEGRQAQYSASSLSPSGESVEQAVARFLSSYPEARNYAEEIAQKASVSTDGEVDGTLLERAYVAVLREIINDQNQKMCDANQLYALVKQSPEARSAVIRDYLSALHSGREVALMAEGGDIALTPPRRPTTVSEAGQMAVSVIKRKG